MKIHVAAGKLAGWLPLFLPELKLIRVQRSSLVIISRARRERPGDEAREILDSGGEIMMQVIYIILCHSVSMDY